MNEKKAQEKTVDLAEKLSLLISEELSAEVARSFDAEIEGFIEDIVYFALNMEPEEEIEEGLIEYREDMDEFSSEEF